MVGRPGTAPPRRPIGRSRLDDRDRARDDRQGWEQVIECAAHLISIPAIGAHEGAGFHVLDQGEERLPKNRRYRRRPPARPRPSAGGLHEAIDEVPQCFDAAGEDQNGVRGLSCISRLAGFGILNDDEPMQPLELAERRSGRRDDGRDFGRPPRRPRARERAHETFRAAAIDQSDALFCEELAELDPPHPGRSGRCRSPIHRRRTPAESSSARSTGGACLS